jgi:hypothetical protein
MSDQETIQIVHLMWFYSETIEASIDWYVYIRGQGYYDSSGSFVDDEV